MLRRAAGRAAERLREFCRMWGIIWKCWTPQLPSQPLFQGESMQTFFLVYQVSYKVAITQFVSQSHRDKWQQSYY